VREPGSNSTQFERSRAGSGASMMGSCRTVPVNAGAGARRVGFDPQRRMSMGFLSFEFLNRLVGKSAHGTEAEPARSAQNESPSSARRAPDHIMTSPFKPRPQPIRERPHD
jgi:hypothetical protein